MRPKNVVFALILGGASITLASCSSLNGPLGEASCRASTAGQCAGLSNRTFYYRATGGLVYYAPSGTFYEASTTTILKGRWRVDETGRTVLRSKPYVGNLGPAPIANVTDAPSVAGDPGKLSTKSAGFYVQHYDDRSFETLLEQAAAR